MWQISPIFIPYLVTLILLAVIIILLFKRRSIPGAFPLMLLIFAGFLWALGNVLGMSAVDIEMTFLFFKLELSGKMFFGTFMLMFLIKYTGKSQNTSSTLVALILLFPITSFILLWTNNLDIHSMFIQTYQFIPYKLFNIMEYKPGTWFWIDYLYNLIIIIISNYILIKTNLNNSAHEKKQNYVTTIALNFPLVINLLYQLKISPFYPLDISPLAFLVTASLLAYNIDQFDFLNIWPIARDVVFENIRDLVIVLDSKNAITDMTPSARNIFQKNGKTVIGKEANEVLPFLSHLFEMFDPDKGIFDEVKLESNNATRYYDLRISSITDDHDNIAGSVIFLYDITERRNAEEFANRERLRRKEQEQILIQKSKMAAMGEMLGAIAHQWRQPLNALGLIIQDVRDAFDYGEMDRDYINQSVDNAMRQIQYLSSTIDDFRGFFKKDKNKKIFDIRGAFLEVISLVSIQFRNYNVKIRLEFHCSGGKKPFQKIEISENIEEIIDIPDYKINTSGFPNEFKQVLLNIIQNAKDSILEKKSEEQGLIHILVSLENNHIIIRIKDNGKGIPPSKITRIFEPYFTTKEQSQGTGIGLYMSKVIIEKNMEGTIVASNIPDGAMFTIKLKAADTT